MIISIIKLGPISLHLTFKQFRLLGQAFNANFPFSITWLFFFSRKLNRSFYDKLVIRLRDKQFKTILFSLVWLKTELDSTQSYYHCYHYMSRFMIPSWQVDKVVRNYSVCTGNPMTFSKIGFYTIFETQC